MEKGSFQKSPFSRDSREPLDCGKQRRIRPFSRDAGELRDHRDSRDSSSEKTPFVMTPFSGADNNRGQGRRALDYQGRVGILSIVRWNLRPVIFGVYLRLAIS